MFYALDKYALLRLDQIAFVFLDGLYLKILSLYYSCYLAKDISYVVYFAQAYFVSFYQ
jgi:hypothetical protein